METRHKRPKMSHKNTKKEAKNKENKHKKAKDQALKTQTMSTMMIELTQVAAWSFVSY